VKKLYALALAGVLGVAGLVALSPATAQAAPVTPAPMSALASNTLGVGPFYTWAAAHEMAVDLIRYHGWSTAVVIEGPDGLYYVGAAD
jgi:hypothetical protein